jgi:large subunit ribosomal protein LX
MLFRVEGYVKLGEMEKNFSKEIEAKSENDAKNKVFSEFGSKNGVKRTAVRIEKISKVNA